MVIIFVVEAKQYLMYKYVTIYYQFAKLLCNIQQVFQQEYH